MPASDITILRKRGMLKEAFAMAKAELDAEPDNVWAKRSISWVYYEYAKRIADNNDLTGFIKCIEAILALGLPADEVMIFDQLAWQIGKIVYRSVDEQNSHIRELIRIFRLTKDCSFTKPSKQYSFLLKAFHKALKRHGSYLDLPEWWGLENLEPEDFEIGDLPGGKKTMALAEQVYVGYAKHLLPHIGPLGETIFDRAKTEAFLPSLTALIKDHPEYQYPQYFKAKLLIALGDKEHVMAELLPFARKKSGDFWVWELLAEAFPEDNDVVFACYCRALLCKSPEEMLVKLRQAMASMLIARKMFNEARAEIDRVVNMMKENGWKVPKAMQDWTDAAWYRDAKPGSSNVGLYKMHASRADSILYADIPEETVIVEFVNSSRKILNFITAAERTGFFKYDRFLDKVEIGETLQARLEINGNEAPSRVYTLSRVNDEELRRQFMKPVEGSVRIMDGKPFGFIDDIFIPPDIVSKFKLVDGMTFKGQAVKTYDKKKERWGWKYLKP
jgi:hypothetical protein